MIKQEILQDTLVYTMENEQLRVSLAPTLGNNLFRVYDKTAKREVLLVPDSMDSLVKAPGHSGTPLMFPPNRVRNGAFHFRGRDYQLEINTPEGHHIHGFLRNHPWKVTDSGQQGQVSFIKSTFAFAEHPDILKQFPHAVIIEMTYVLEGPTLAQKVKIINHSNAPVPAAFGLHTWFRLDDEPEKWTLELPVTAIWELDKENMPTGKLLSLGEYEALASTGMNLKGLNLDTVFQIGDKGREAVLRKEGYELRYQISDLYKHWVIYTRGEAKDIICLEPYTWVTNAPNLDLDPSVTGIIGVEPGKAIDLEVTLVVNG
ncbi:aldose 1-epimerase [Paenibacillus sp. CC-CFT747]|nr:aldose 1-epimerase [Paenibacillus sp. CC-CFT747]